MEVCSGGGVEVCSGGAEERRSGRVEVWNLLVPKHVPGPPGARRLRGTGRATTCVTVKVPKQIF